MKKHATALRAFTHADETFADKQVILGMDAGQFADWSAEGVDLVREATAAEVAATRGDKPAAVRKPNRARKAKPASPIAPAAPDQAPEPAPAEPEA